MLFLLNQKYFRQLIPISYVFSCLTKAEESFVDLSDVVVNTAIHKDMVIFNNSNCSLHYILHVDQQMEGTYADEAMAIDGMGKFGQLVGCLKI